MNIFVTGASGFVGGAFVKAAVARHAVTAMSRSEKSDAEIAALGAAVVRCSLDDVTADAMRGADAVVHCAAYVEDWGPWRDYWRYNVDATKRMLRAARGAGVKRFVHIGTEAALFYGQDMRDVDESYPLALHSPFPYSRTKAYAEQAVRAASDPQHGFETIVVRPRSTASQARAEAKTMNGGGGAVAVSLTVLRNRLFVSIIDENTRPAGLSL